MAKLTDLSLEDLYNRPKITAAVRSAIMLKEDFSKKSENWCNKICTLNCKNPPSGTSIINSSRVDILFIQSHDALDDLKFGRSGERIETTHRNILSYIIKKAQDEEGIPFLNFGISNVTRCKITSADIKKGKPPSTVHLIKCSPYLLEEIQQRKPNVIVSLSTEATKALGSKLSNSRDCGEFEYIEVGGVKIPLVVTLHPKALVMLRQNSSGAFWGPDFLTVIRNDVRKAIRIMQGTLKVPVLDEALERAKKDIIICRSENQVKFWADKIYEIGRNGSVISFDTETTGLDPYDPSAKLLTIQFGWRREVDNKIVAVVVPLWHRENKAYDPQKAWDLLSKILTDPEVKKIGHNVKFDVIYIMKTTGVRTAGILFDTMLMLHSMDSGQQGMYGLKRNVWTHLPETGLGGYESKLPKLTKKKSSSNDEEELEEEAEEES